MTLHERIGQIEDRLKAATPGPWDAHHDDHGDDYGETWVKGSGDDHEDKWNKVCALSYDSSLFENHANNSKFIANCPSDLATLLEVVRVYQLALEVYAMTNESFPEYGDVARDVLTKADEICSRGL
jgi:hypothetical protein